MGIHEPCFPSAAIVASGVTVDLLGSSDVFARSSILFCNIGRYFIIVENQNSRRRNWKDSKRELDCEGFHVDCSEGFVSSFKLSLRRLTLYILQFSYDMAFDFDLGQEWLTTTPAAASGGNLDGVHPIFAPPFTPDPNSTTFSLLFTYKFVILIS